MPSLLHLDSSAHRSTESISRRLGATFAEAWRAEHGPAAAYTYRDLAADPVPPLDTAFCALGRRAERLGLLSLATIDALIETEAERRAWALTRPLIDEILAADTVVIGAPMYNYSVPAALKAWIDRVSFPGAFTDPDDHASLLSDTQFVVISARGGTYAPGTRRHARDFFTPYLRAYLLKQGATEENIHFAVAELTLAGLAPHMASSRAQAADSLAAAKAQVSVLARRGTAIASYSGSTRDAHDA
ncbi:MAG TPA: NAD(P)H-dependent oxidoreductase [Actinocrinis sp.]|nr:NAD(P)H-dependent oxidoreductase [Actinocrinis sp.]